jgi:hypothetical protein
LRAPCVYCNRQNENLYFDRKRSKLCKINTKKIFIRTRKNFLIFIFVFAA